MPETSEQRITVGIEAPPVTLPVMAGGEAAEDIARGETEAIDVPSLRQRSLPEIGPYRLNGVIGRGGIGVVYRATVIESCAVAIGTEVALKVLGKGELSAADRRRFEREASYLQALRHPSIVHVLDVGEHDGRPFLVMEHIDGETFDQVLNATRDERGKGQISEDRLIEWMIPALEGLHTAHLAGILHRDLKPGNLMVDRSGLVKLLDFGLAQRLDSDSRLTASGSVLGTPAYMSPEQASGDREHTGVRSDIYSMGAVCYELVTGEQPYTASNSVQVLRKIIEGPPPRPSYLQPLLSRDLETIILKAMSRERRDRYPSAEAMAADLRRLRTGRRIRARRMHPLTPLWRATWRRRRLLMTTALISFVVAVIATLLVRRAVLLIQEQARDLDRQQTIDQADLPTWIEELDLRGQVDWSGSTSGYEVRDHVLLGDGVRLLPLPPVTGNLRLRLDVVLLGATPFVELSICDRDIGQGYTVRVEHSANGEIVSLLRGRPGALPGDVTMVKSAPVVLPSRFTLGVDRTDATISVTVDDIELIRFSDLAPIEGPDNAGAHIACDPTSVVVADVLWERQRMPERVSQLQVADTMRQDGRYAAALNLYDRFLRDFPDHPDARAATYRQGLCLKALGRTSEALALFQAMALANEDDPDYLIAATFQAWHAALELGRFEDADTYLASIRDRFDTEALFALIPRDLLESVTRNYLDRAGDARTNDPERAVELFLTAGEIADHLDLGSLVPPAYLGAGDVLLFAGDPDSALGYYRRIGRDTSLPLSRQLMGRLKMAEALRIQGAHEEASALYRGIIAAAGDQEIEQAQWARLWLADLMLYLGDRQLAADVLQESPEQRSQPGQFISAMLRGKNPQVRRNERFYANDAAYLRAVLAETRGRWDDYRDGLQDTIRIGPAHDWPSTLARQLLDEIESSGGLAP